MKEKNDISRLAREAAKLAEEAILTEAVLTPKPGLVDAKDRGAHEDMDIFTFLRSAVSLRDGFEEMFMAGYREGISAKELLNDLRPKGMSVEQKMFEATENINTHKGIIFSMGLLLASVGRYIRAVDYSGHNLPVFTQKDTEAVLENIRTMTEGIVQNDFKDIDQKSSLTHGEKLYVEFGFTGIRGEAEKGYPVVRDFALPMLRESHNGDLSLTERLLEVLIMLMRKVEDSNIVTRGGMVSLGYVRGCADEFMAEGGIRRPDALKKLESMNEDFIERNLSPGGSADLLSMAIFLGKMENIL